MKKLNYLVLLVLGIVLISFGRKNIENKETNIAEVKEAIIKECLISELDGLSSKKNITKLGSKDLYTGIAVLKDQSESIIQKVEIKNVFHIVIY
jgi:cobalamin biosynthesis Co2+ chelatase CbiK